VVVSTDGVSDKMYMRDGDVSTLDILFDNNVSILPKYFTFYVKHAGVAPTSGAFYIETLYGER